MANTLTAESHACGTDATGYEQANQAYQEIFDTQSISKLNTEYVANGTLLSDIYHRLRAATASTQPDANHIEKSNQQRLAELIQITSAERRCGQPELVPIDNDTVSDEVWNILLPEYHYNAPLRNKQLSTMDWHRVLRVLQIVKAYFDSKTGQQTSSSTPTPNKDSDANSNHSSDDSSNQNINISDNQSSSLSSSMAIPPANLVKSLFPTQYFQRHTAQHHNMTSMAAKKPINLTSYTPPTNHKNDNAHMFAQQPAFLTQQQNSKYRQTHFAGRCKQNASSSPHRPPDNTKQAKLKEPEKDEEEEENAPASPPPNQILLSAKKAMSTYRERNLDAAMLASGRKIYKNTLPNTMRSKTRKCVSGIPSSSNHNNNAQKKYSQTPSANILHSVHSLQDNEHKAKYQAPAEPEENHPILKKLQFIHEEDEGGAEDEEEETRQQQEDKRSSISSTTSHYGWKSREPSQEQIEINEAPQCVSRSKSIDISMLSHVLVNVQDANNQVASTHTEDDQQNANEVVEADHEQDDEQCMELKAEILRLSMEIEDKNLVINEYENKLNAKSKEFREKEEAFKAKQEEFQKSTQEINAKNESLQNELFALQSKMMQKEAEYEVKCHSFIDELSKKDNEIKCKDSENIALENETKTLQAKLEYLKNRVSKIGKIDLCKSQLMRLTADYQQLQSKVQFELQQKKQDFICMASAINTALKYGHENMSHHNLLMNHHDAHSPRANQQQQIEAANDEFRKETDLETIKTERDEFKSNLMKLTMTYQKEKKLRKQLLEQIIDLKGNIRVFCRVRPKIRRQITDKDNSSNTAEGETPELMATTCLDDERVVINDESKKYFSFDQVYPPEASQETIFMDVKPLIQSAVDGYNVCIFAYGQTGSGKTFTMEGTPERPGIIYESFDELFKLRATANNVQAGNGEDNEMEMKVYLSCLEIYNEKIRDLLSDINDSSTNNNNHNSNNHKINPCDLKAKLSKCGKKVLVPGLTKAEVSNTENVRDILQNVAYKNRSTGVTNMNEHSSRSHALVFVDIVTKQSSSRLVLIDLAGSERVKKTGVSGTAFDEARNINKSLSALGNVISALQNKQKHIPFRDSQLTYLLYDCLGGNSRALMFCNISCEVFDIKESINTLTFAHRVRRVQLGEAQKNENPNGDDRESQENKEKLDKLESLKQKMKKYKKELEDKEKEIKELKVSTRSYKKEISKLSSSIGVQNNKNVNHQQTRMEYNSLQKEHSRITQEMEKKERIIKKLQGEVNDYKHKYNQMVKHKNHSHSSSNNQISRPRTAAVTTTISNAGNTQKRVRNSRKRKQPSKDDDGNNDENDNEDEDVDEHDASMDAPAQKRRKIHHRGSNNNNNAIAGNGRKSRLKSHNKLPSYLQPTKNSRGRAKNTSNTATVANASRGRSVSLESNPKSGVSQHRNMLNENRRLKKKRHSSLDSILNHNKNNNQQQQQVEETPLLSDISNRVKEITPKQVQQQNEETKAAAHASLKTAAPLTPNSAMLLIASQQEQSNEGHDDDNEQENKQCESHKNAKKKKKSGRNVRKTNQRNKPITLSSLQVQSGTNNLSTMNR
eukprot:CAMPEP_0197024310 /NCGR_PEP_ID=MMETSP1384-20130603/4880_1 /TAXON_ID=29189 /ORGANISM="Ammonia sp." /LENGTH=1568 /DNA_ID=CAMNT_0042452673 /DNA_START=34 /DNA_END=4740 /DNA_ORIENTATION=+